MDDEHEANLPPLGRRLSAFYWRRLGREAGPFGEAVRFRFPPDIVRRLDRIEVLFRGAGYRTVSRSTLVRAAVEALLDDMEREFPEVKE